MPDGEHLMLAGRRAVVTGAGRGIGRSIALAQTLVAEIQALGRRSLAVCCDVTQPEQVGYMAETLLTGLGGLDILVNNAGNAGSHKFLNHPDDLWHRMLAINLTSVYYVTKPLCRR
jgi:NAD(P)-dependent dehydrogenase (short-subunit alcohol dehydrogenase family)